jgi:hypothetical protein
MAYYQDNNTYVGMTLAALQTYDAGIKLDALKPADQTATSFCISDTLGGWIGRDTGPTSTITVGVTACP